HAALHGNAGLAFHGCNALRVLKGIRLTADQTERVRLLAGKPVKQGDRFLVPAEVRGLTPEGKDVLFSRATIVLTERLPDGGPAALPATLPGSLLDRADAYQGLLFHGPLLQGIERIEACGPDGVVGTVAA